MQSEDTPSAMFLRNNDPFQQTDLEEIELAYLFQNPHSVDEKELLQRLVARYTAVLQLWTEILLTAPGKVKHSSKEIQSIIRQTYIKALQHIDKFQGQAGLIPWLFNIAFQVVSSFKRQQGLNLALHRVNYSVEPLFVPSDFYTGYAERIDRLPDKLRLPCILRYLFGLEIPDIAFIINLSEKDIHNRLSAARFQFLGNQTPSHFSTQIQKRADGLLDDNLGEINQLDSHLAECNECHEFRQKLNDLEKQLAIVLDKHWPLPDLSPRELESLVETVMREVAQPRAWWRMKLPLRYLAWITGIALTFIGLAIIFIRVTPVEREFPYTPPPPTPTLQIEPGMIVGMVNIGGRSLFIHCEGEGSPTIIMENGLGIDPPTWNWSNFYTHLAEITRTCMYDRANWGKSDPAPKPRTAQDMVNDLYALLVNAQIPAPYVFAGHDIGGWISRLYAGQYPEEVVGMILVDSIHPDIGLRMSVAYPTQTPNEPSPMTKERYIWANYYDSSIIMPNDSEGWDLRTSAEQVRKVTSLGDVPLLVLTGDLVKYGDFTLIRAIQPMLYGIWSTSERDLLLLSTDSQLIVIQGAGHFMWNDKPDEVVNEIRQFVQQAQATQP